MAQTLQADDSDLQYFHPLLTWLVYYDIGANTMGCLCFLPVLCAI